MSSTYRSSRTALNVVGRTSRGRSLGPALRKHANASSRRETPTVAEAAAATATIRQTNRPPPPAYNVPAQELWKGKEAPGLQDTLRHAHERELGESQHLICIYEAIRDALQRNVMAIRGLLVPMDEQCS